MKVAVLGAGYVGLVSGLVLFEQGHEVLFLDRDPSRLDGLARGEVPFDEPGVAELLVLANASGRVSYANSVDSASGCDVAFVCVPTPARDDGTLDVDGVLEVAESLAEVARGESCTLRGVFVRSTCTPGTARAACALLNAHRPRSSHAIPVGSLPEFLREGSALADHRDADRIVVGADDPALHALARLVYASSHAPFVATTPESAELSKLAANAWLATCISFSNEIARVAERLPNVDADVVFRGLHHDRRLSRPAPAGINAYLAPGAGFGGSCLGKDTRALETFARALGERASLLEATSSVNRDQPLRLVSRVADRARGLEGRQVLVLGLAFKAGTDDVRDSIATPVVADLLERGARVSVHDPRATEAFLATLPPSRRSAVIATRDWRERLVEAEVVFVLTTEPEYATHLAVRLHELGTPIVVGDGRSVLRDVALPAHVTYVGVGLGPISNVSDAPETR